MHKFLDIVEQKGQMIFTFGRFNPPTTGHEKLIQKVASVAGTNPFRIYPSQSQNPKKDPLPFALKVAYMRKMFPRYAKNIVAGKEKTVFEIVTKTTALACQNFMMGLVAQGYDSCPMEGFDHKRVKKILSLNRQSHVVMVLGIGKRDPKGIYGERFRIDDDLFIKII